MEEQYPAEPTPGQEGWFQDPDNQLYARFWDGAAWTNHRIIKETPQQTGPPAFRPQSSPGPIPQRRLPKPSLGEVAAPGEPPISPHGGNGIFMILLRKVFGDYRDPKQRIDP